MALSPIVFAATLCLIAVNHTSHPVTLHGCTWYNVDGGWACNSPDDDAYQAPFTILLIANSHVVIRDDDAVNAYGRLWDDWLHQGVDLHWRDPCPEDKVLKKLWT